MKKLLVFLEVLIALLIIIPAHNLIAQATHSLNNNKDIPYSLYDIKFEPTISAKANAPFDQIYLPDTLILYSMSDTIRMSASYDPRGWNDQILVQVWFSGHWVNYTRQIWTSLDSTTQSNLTLRQTWLNGQWQNSELDSSTYDANGNMLVHLFKYWSQGAWKDSILSSRTYDANGNMLTNVGWYMINNQWTNHDRSTYTYDANGNMLTYLFE